MLPVLRDLFLRAGRSFCNKLVGECYVSKTFWKEWPQRVIAPYTKT